MMGKRGVSEVKSMFLQEVIIMVNKYLLLDIRLLITTTAGAPQIVAKPDNTLVVSFMTDEDTSLHHWPDEGADFKIVTGGPVQTGSWGNKVTVSGVQSNWPGLLTKSDGSVLGCSGNGGAKCHSITFS